VESSSYRSWWYHPIAHGGITLSPTGFNTKKNVFFPILFQKQTKKEGFFIHFFT
jgi:hypothetical protein